MTLSLRTPLLLALCLLSGCQREETPAARHSRNARHGGYGGYGGVAEVGVELEWHPIEAPPAGAPPTIVPFLDDAPPPFSFVEVEWVRRAALPFERGERGELAVRFWLASLRTRAQMDPDSLHFVARARRLPPPAQRLPFFVAETPMDLPRTGGAYRGMRWRDVRVVPSAGAGEQPHRFSWGSWDGRIVYFEVSIDEGWAPARGEGEAIPIPTVPEVAQRGWYPRAYRIGVDAKTGALEVALTELAWR